MISVKQNNTVKVHYEGKLDDGQVFDSSANREPLQFKVGDGKVIPGFEQAVIDMKLNDKKTIKIPSEEAYGPIRKELIHEVDRKHLPQDLNPEVGTKLVSKQPNGKEVVVVITEVNDNNVIIDANHPLAGKDLTFDIEVVDIK